MKLEAEPDEVLRSVVSHALLTWSVGQLPWALHQGFVLQAGWARRAQSPRSHQGFTSPAWPVSLAAPSPQPAARVFSCVWRTRTWGIISSDQAKPKQSTAGASGVAALGQFMNEGMSISQIQSPLMAREGAQWFELLAMHSSWLHKLQCTY